MSAEPTKSGLHARLGAVLAACLVASLAASCGGGGDRDGSLCARCSVDDPCAATHALTDADDIGFFCGDTVAQECTYCRANPDDPTGSYLCSVSLACHLRAERGTSARSCYPLLSDSSLADYECDGASPDFNLSPGGRASDAG